MGETEFAIHVDCDNLWIYETEYGLTPSDQYDAIYQQALPTILDLFKKYKISGTFFVIGRDTQMDSCQNFCQRAVNEGHKIANHTMNHNPSFARLDEAERRVEIIEAHDAIGNLTGSMPKGYRSPGYYTDGVVQKTLCELGYLYDSSVIPGPAVLMMRAYLALHGKAGHGKRLGRLRDVIGRRTPHVVYRANGTNLFEAPLAISPRYLIPIHTTFVYKFGLSFLMNALEKLTSQPGHHIYLMHAIDAMDLINDNQFIGKVPAFNWPFDQRISLLNLICKFVTGITRLTEDAACEWAARESHS